MKFLICAALLPLAIFAACKKDRTCTCITTTQLTVNGASAAPDYLADTVITHYKHVRKSELKATCSDLDYTSDATTVNSIGSTSTSVGFERHERKCTLK